MRPLDADIGSLPCDWNILSLGRLSEIQAKLLVLEQKKLIDEARADAQRTVDEVRSRLAEDVANARRTARDAAGEIARLVAAKVLGRSA